MEKIIEKSINILSILFAIISFCLASCLLYGGLWYVITGNNIYPSYNGVGYDDGFRILIMAISMIGAAAMATLLHIFIEI